jgi:hypothetical protein
MSAEQFPAELHPTYVYTSITSDQLRLLQLIPEPGHDGPVSLKITTTARELVPSYVALSYEWCQASADDPAVTLGTASERRSLHVIRKNLELFLKELRSGFEDQQWFWCDSICIDQKNVPERNEQVRRMGDIYRNASAAVAWLGPAGTATKLAFENIDLTSDPCEGNVQFMRHFDAFFQHMACS